MILRRWLRREEKETNLERELRFHIEERVADLVRSGVSEEDARRRVRLEFGAAEQIKEETRNAKDVCWQPGGVERDLVNVGPSLYRQISVEVK